MLRVLLILCLVSLVSASSAQRVFLGFVHGEYAEPTHASYSYGLGLEAGAALGWGKTFLTGTVGYTWVNTKSSANAANFRYNPYKLGLRRYLLGKTLFLVADAGMAGVKFSGDDHSTSRFTGDLGVGVKLIGVEAIAEYTTVAGSGTGGWFSLKAGFTLGL